MPLATPVPDYRQPEDIARLKRGVTVQKHGREGDVKERLIRLTAAETAIFWQVHPPRSSMFMRVPCPSHLVHVSQAAQEQGANT